MGLLVADEAGLILFSPVRFVLLVFSLSDKLPLVPLGFVGAETVSPTTYRVLITTDYLSSRLWKKAERKIIVNSFVQQLWQETLNLRG